MDEKERAEINKLNAEAEKLKEEARSLRHGIWIKWYTAAAATFFWKYRIFQDHQGVLFIN